MEPLTLTGGTLLFFGRKNKSQTKLHLDLGDLQNEKEQLSSFLQPKLKVSVSPYGDKLAVPSENLSAQELQRAVTKFVYHRNFNTTHWVSIKGTTIKINKFKETAKKKEKHEDKTHHQNLTESWGL